jgi:ADP-dependent NAD(P)H-hydrate dehydratase / NAD(P)H-hydrate epimerase
MKIISSESMGQMEARAIGEFGIPGMTLMENAGKGCAEAIIASYGACQEPRAVIFAGKGNNGGDGYVIARLLKDRGWHVAVFVLAHRDEIRGDARANLDRLAGMPLIFYPEQGGTECCRLALREATVIVDGLLGTGLKSEVAGLYAEMIGMVNDSGKPVVAVDIPSGIDASSGRVLGCAVKADMTVTFAMAKYGHLLYPGAEYCGRLRIVDIGIPSEITASAEGYEFIDGDAVKPLIRRRSRSAHKGDCGHCLIIAGSTGMSGAAAMAANSAVRSGAGLVTLAAPAGINQILEMKTTEVMTLPLPDGGSGHLCSGAKGSIEEALIGKKVVAMGPGIARHPETANLVRELSTSLTLPLIIDADGLNAVSEDTGLLLSRKSDIVIMTPHPGEMGRLAGLSITQVEEERIGVARAFSVKYGVYLILKGARSVIATPGGDVAINASGNPGMASGGMGDVLTGILAAFIAQGYDPFTACKLGVFIHGHAADLVAEEKGEIGISAVDVQERLPYAIKELTGLPLSAGR